MEIKVLGTGCARCKKAFEVVSQVVSQQGVDARVEYVTDIRQIMAYGVMTTPAIVVDGVVKVKGVLPSEADVLKALVL